MSLATKEQAEQIFAAIKERDEDRQARMPDTISALDQICTAKERLHKLGWSEASYCPKDGTPFAVIQYGSTGIFSAFYSGKWPRGHLIFADSATHPAGHMWKPLDKLTPEEAEAVKQSDADTAAFIARLGASFGDRE